MFYDFPFTIPKTATKTKPEVKDINLTFGVVHKITMFWWPGPHGLVHLIIKQYDHQVLPTNIDEAFHYDNYAHVMEERIELFEPPFSLKLVGWAEGCDYDHEVIVGLGILHPSCFPEYPKPDTRLEKLRKAFGIK